MFSKRINFDWILPAIWTLIVFMASTYGLQTAWAMMSRTEANLLIEEIDEQENQDEDDLPPPSASAAITPVDLDWLKWRWAIYSDF